MTIGNTNNKTVIKVNTAPEGGKGAKAHFNPIASETLVSSSGITSSDAEVSVGGYIHFNTGGSYRRTWPT
jgi:hypothetical protein